ncbi:MAG TPA: methyltransferase domain-containing protein [Streptosporangiaceae bacterium]|nr:methyltransferase domain-containing protein [Streptosporangiaceae bacterium]
MSGTSGASPSAIAFDELVAEAVAAPFTGWDFSWLDARSTSEDLPWSYRAEAARYAGTARVMLDMGTGGGEELTRITPRARHTIATESWRPNVPVAARRLKAAGIPVIHCDGAPDNMSEEGISAAPDRAGLLPFADGVFDLVTNRHESFRADELRRVLAPGGAFVTQQVDYHSDDALFELLGLDPPDEPDTWLPLAVAQLNAAGLTIAHTAAGQETRHFEHVGAVIYYLKVVGWAIPDYSLEAFLPALRAAWEEPARWPLPLSGRRFIVVARKATAATA